MPKVAPADLKNEGHDRLGEVGLDVMNRSESFAGQPRLPQLTIGPYNRLLATRQSGTCDPQESGSRQRVSRTWVPPFRSRSQARPWKPRLIQCSTVIARWPRSRSQRPWCPSKGGTFCISITGLTGLGWPVCRLTIAGEVATSCAGFSGAKPAAGPSSSSASRSPATRPILALSARARI